jgi:hypothetical protein
VRPSQAVDAITSQSADVAQLCDLEPRQTATQLLWGCWREFKINKSFHDAFVILLVGLRQWGRADLQTPVAVVWEPAERIGPRMVETGEWQVGMAERAKRDNLCFAPLEGCAIKAHGKNLSNRSCQTNAGKFHDKKDSCTITG